MSALSPRERAALDALIETDGTSSALSEQLQVSEGAVRSTFSRIGRKTGLHSRTQLAVWWTAQLMLSVTQRQVK